MYIKKELIKSINEMYYRYFQDTNLSPLNINDKNENFVECLTLATNHNDFASNVNKQMYTDLVLDYIYTLNTKEKFALQSPIGVKLQSTIFKVSIAVEQKIFNQVNPLSDTFYEVIKILKTSKNSCLVGGCVRDSILGLYPKDYDFATDISYNELERLFKESGFKVQEEGKQFLVMIISKNGEQYEIANFRKDGTYIDGRRPETVEIGTIEDDSSRRDFSVNTLYYNLTSNTVMDPTGLGINDIENKVLRFVGKPEDRLAEDALRLFRFYRFLSKLKDFTPDSKSLKAVRTNFAKAIETTSPERIKNEIERMIGLWK